MTDIKSDYAILAMYESGNEYVVYDELTYEQAKELLEKVKFSNTEKNILFMISDGAGDLPKLEGQW